jgi:hypothetical protein
VLSIHLFAVNRWISIRLRRGPSSPMSYLHCSSCFFFVFRRAVVAPPLPASPLLSHLSPRPLSLPLSPLPLHAALQPRRWPTTEQALASAPHSRPPYCVVAAGSAAGRGPLPPVPWRLCEKRDGGRKKRAFLQKKIPYMFDLLEYSISFVL